MTYTEIIGDLFSAPEEYYFAHCISSDFGMGAGIVVEFNKRYNMKNILMLKYNGFSKDYKLFHSNGTCIQEGRVFNLITKHLVWEKPTYESVTGALTVMKDLMLQQNIKHLAMPTIACGIDGLQWAKVSEIIKSVFSDTDVDIRIYKLK